MDKKEFVNQLVSMRSATFMPMLDILHCHDAIEYFEQIQIDTSPEKNPLLKVLVQDQLQQLLVQRRQSRNLQSETIDDVPEQSDYESMTEIRHVYGVQEDNRSRCISIYNQESWESSCQTMQTSNNQRMSGHIMQAGKMNQNLILQLLHGERQIQRPGKSKFLTQTNVTAAKKISQQSTIKLFDQDIQQEQQTAKKFTVQETKQDQELSVTLVNTENYRYQMIAKNKFEVKPTVELDDLQIQKDSEILLAKFGTSLISDRSIKLVISPFKQSVNCSPADQRQSVELLSDQKVLTNSKMDQTDQNQPFEISPIRKGKSNKIADSETEIRQSSLPTPTHFQSYEADNKCSQKDEKYSSQRLKRIDNNQQTGCNKGSYDFSEIVKVVNQDRDSHTDNQERPTGYKRERIIGASSSNKDSKMLTMVSQAKFDRKKFLGDIVARKINASQENVFLHKPNQITDEQRNIVRMRNTYCNLMNETNLSEKSLDTAEHHHAIYPYPYQQKTIEVPQQKSTTHNKTFFKRPKVNNKIDTFFISASTLETNQTANSVNSKPKDLPLSQMLQQYTMILQEKQFTVNQRQITRTKNRKISEPKNYTRSSGSADYERTTFTIPAKRMSESIDQRALQQKNLVSKAMIRSQNLRKQQARLSLPFV